MKRLLLALCLATLPLAQIGCSTQTTTLEAGGAYSDATLAKIDQSILDASHAMTAFVAWANTNSVYLARWPEVGNAAKNIEAQKDGWIRDAYQARDAYASASVAYKTALAQGIVGQMPPNRAKVDAALAVLTNVVAQVVQYQQAHKP